MTTHRLDEALAARGLVQSRARARDAVLRGIVRVNGEAARKPSQNVTDRDVLSLADDSGRHVARSALKLIHALEHFGVEAAGRICLDIGASTGGFTEVLLERGASHVTAIDVGHGQMVPQLAEDPRVTLLERLNARALEARHVRTGTSLVVCDVSFISLKLALPPILALAGAGCHLIALIKPQFEVGREGLGKGGLVTDSSLHNQVCGEIAASITQAGWVVQGLTESPLEGGDGNREFLVHAIKQAGS